MTWNDQNKLATKTQSAKPDTHAMHRYSRRIIQLSLWIACILAALLLLLGIHLTVLIPYLQVIVPLVFLVFLFTMKRPK